MLKDIVPEEDFNVKTSKSLFKTLTFILKLVCLEPVAAFTICFVVVFVVKNLKLSQNKLLLKDLKNGSI